jgi:Uma2 family endonuclease
LYRRAAAGIVTAGNFGRGRLMSAIAPSPKLLTIEEHLRLPDDGRKTELVRGRVVEMNPPYPFHGFVCGQVYDALRDFVKPKNLGRVLPNDSGVVTERDPGTVRGADVCYYSYTRLPQGPMPEDAYLDVSPDLVVEVMSPSDRWSLVFEKVTDYLVAGVTVVCVVNPRTRSAVLYRDDQDPEPFSTDAELTIPDVLPGFRVPLRQSFE